MNIRATSQLLARCKVSFVCLAVLTATLMLGPRQAEASISTPVKAANFNGTLNITHFATQAVNGVQQLVAIGSVTGTLNAPNGQLQNVAIGNLAIPVTSLSDPTCPILSLTLGPLHLDVLGLVVDLNQIVLNITAVGAPGNLLGNLLCSVANLLNPGQVSTLADLLNQILALL